MYEMSKNTIAISEDEQLRSNFVRSLVQTTPELFTSITRSIPKTIVQFWDDPDNIPLDVQECIESWSYLDDIGYERVLFNEQSGRRFIAKTFSLQHVEAFDRCYHPAMKSDYFRLCFILAHGGFYIDADDAYNGSSIDQFFRDDRLKLQPLCYDIETDMMIQPETFMNPINYSSNWIFYFNNNPLVAAPRNPVVKYALQRATRILIEADKNDFPEIQSTTGPGNLTASLIANMHQSKLNSQENYFLVLSDWEVHAQTIWPLSYRQDSRNWRLSNQKYFSHEVKSPNGCVSE